MKKSSVLVELSTIHETASEVMSVTESNVPEIDQCKLSENTSFEQMHKNKKEGTVLLIGDSLARGFGNHLKSQHSMLDSLAFGDANIEDITKKVEELKDNESHFVLMVGTNNLVRWNNNDYEQVQRSGQLAETEIQKNQHR